MGRTTKRWQTKPPGNMYALRQDAFFVGGEFDLPTVAMGVVPEGLDTLVTIREIKTYPPEKRATAGVSWFTDDYRLEVLWRRAEDYVDLVKDYGVVLAPDFSIYDDWPLPICLYNTYRSRWVTAMWQSRGLNVIPTATWGSEETLEFAFAEIPAGCPIALTTFGVLSKKKQLELPETDGEHPRDLFRAGIDRLMNEVEPSTILCYGASQPSRDLMKACGVDDRTLHFSSFWERNPRRREKKGDSDGRQGRQDDMGGTEREVSGEEHLSQHGLSVSAAGNDLSGEGQASHEGRAADDGQVSRQKGFFEFLGVGAEEVREGDAGRNDSAELVIPGGSGTDKEE